MAREAIGTIICPMCGDLAEVRQDKNGKLYYSGAAGLITPRLLPGQQWIRDNMVSNDFREMTAANDDDFNVQVDEHETTAKAPSFLSMILGGDDE